MGKAQAMVQADRRRSERTDLVVRVDYQTVDDLFSEFARNINEGGIFVETDAPPEVGSSVDLQFKLPGKEDPFRLKGTVVRISNGEGAEAPGMGIEFEDLGPDEQQCINELVRDLRAL